MNAESIIELKPISAELCRAISSYLHNLREIVFEVLWPTPLQDLRCLLEFPEEMPALRTIHFVGVDVWDLLSSEPIFLFPIPAAISQVHSIHAHEKNKIAIGFFDVIQMSWSRQSINGGEEAGRTYSDNTFAVHSMSCTALGGMNYRTDYMADKGKNLISQVEGMKFICGMECNSSCVLDVIRDAQKLTKLHFVMFDNEGSTISALINGIHELPPGITELLITFAPTYHLEGTAELWDTRSCNLLSALDERHSKRLNSFESQISPAFHNPSIDESQCPWSSKTKQWCDGRHVAFVSRHREDKTDRWCSYRLHFNN